MDGKAEADDQSAGGYEERQSMELAIAALEMRLRGAITELVQPTIQRTTLIVADVDSIRSQVSQHTRGLQEVQLGQFKVMEQMALISGFQEEMNKWDVQRRAHEISIDEKVDVVVQKLDTYRYSLEQKESALHHLHRSIDRMTTELNHAMDEQETQKDHFESRIDNESRKLNRFKSELEVRLAGMELKHNALTDELWGEETGLAKVAGELRKTVAMFASLEGAVAELQQGKAEAALLDKLRTDVGKMVHEANTSISAMRQSVGNVVNDVREHFRTASQTIAEHNATFVSEVREEYQAELDRSAHLRDEVQGFMGTVKTDIDGLDARVANAAAKADSLAAEAREEVEELNRRRKSDKSSADNELKALKKRLSGVFENSDSLMRAMEHTYSIVQTMLESDLIQCSLEQQDSIDRKKIALIGVKDEDKTLARSSLTQPVKPRPETQQQDRPPRKGTLRGHGALAKPQDPVVHVDNRCVSCSGQAPLVLSAFKMACLQYTPSPVEHAGDIHDRGELLKMRRGMLEGASEALADGPSALRDGFAGTSTLAATTGAPDRAGHVLSEYAAAEARVRPPNSAGSSRGGTGLKLPSLHQQNFQQSLQQAMGALTAR